MRIAIAVHARVLECRNDQLRTRRLFRLRPLTGVTLNLGEPADCLPEVVASCVDDRYVDDRTCMALLDGLSPLTRLRSQRLSGAHWNAHRLVDLWWRRHFGDAYAGWVAATQRYDPGGTCTSALLAAGEPAGNRGRATRVDPITVLR